MSIRVLVTGASIAGTTTAWWLAKFGCQVHVVERSAVFRDGGQNVDVRGNAREVLRKMGLEEAAFARSTREKGTDWVDENDHVVARFESEESESDLGPTAELEIRRGDIARILYDAVRERVSFRFDDSIKAIEQHEHGVDVTFAGGLRAHYDVVVVAEGVGSSTRELVFPGENDPRWMDMTIAYFSIPSLPKDSDYARQYNTIDGRGATLKRSLNDKLGAYLGIQKRSEGENEWSQERQRAFIQNQFANDGWEIPRILEGMRSADDFYFDVLRQVRMDRWSHGRVVLTGDSAWCPTPLTGIGTTLAIVGGYVLAGELLKHPGHREAFEGYERIMRPFVKEGQNMPKIVPRLLWPHSRTGIKMLRGAMRVANTPLIKGLVNNGFARDASHIALPDY